MTPHAAVDTTCIPRQSLPRRSLPRGRHAVLFALCGLTVPASAAANELCIICEEPAALYRCQADGADPLPAGLQIRCVTEIAKSGAHGRCRVDRTRAIPACDGALVKVAAPPPSLPTGAPPTAAPPVGPPQGGPSGIAAQPPKPSGPPQTMEALAKEAARQSKEGWDKTTETVKETSETAGKQIEKAGSVVGGALKKSWDCVASFFARC